MITDLLAELVEKAKEIENLTGLPLDENIYHEIIHCDIRGLQHLIRNLDQVLLILRK